LAARWSEQQVLDRVIASIAAGRDDEALALAPRFASHPSVFVGILVRMIQSGRPKLVQFVVKATENDRSLAEPRFARATLLHYGAGTGCLEVVALLLRLGVDPNLEGRGRTPLYCVANGCASETGPEVVRALVRAGADVNGCSGVTRATALHAAARRGMWRSHERCLIWARPSIPGIAKVTRLYNGQSIVARTGSRNCYTRAERASTSRSLPCQCLLPEKSKSKQSSEGDALLHLGPAEPLDVQGFGFFKEPVEAAHDRRHECDDRQRWHNAPTG
jgi:Ankyrin repeats (3 copies)